MQCSAKYVVIFPTEMLTSYPHPTTYNFPAEMLNILFLTHFAPLLHQMRITPQGSFSSVVQACLYFMQALWLFLLLITIIMWKAHRTKVKKWLHFPHGSFANKIVFDVSPVTHTSRKFSGQLGCLYHILSTKITCRTQFREAEKGYYFAQKCTCSHIPRQICEHRVTHNDWTKSTPN